MYALTRIPGQRLPAPVSAASSDTRQTLKRIINTQSHTHDPDNRIL